MRRVAQVTKNSVHHLGSRTEVLDVVCDLMDKCVGISDYTTDDPYVRTIDSVNRGIVTSTILHSETTRFRKRSFEISVQSIIGKLSNVQVENMCCAAIHGIKSQIQAEQRNGDWSMCAYEVVTTIAKRSARHPNTLESQEYNIFSGKPSPNRLKMGFVEHERFQINCVFYDVLENEEIDNWSERTGRPGSMANGKIPRSLQLQIRDGKRIIKETLLEQKYLELDRDIDKTLKALKSEKVVWEKANAEKVLGLSNAEDVNPESMTSKQVSVAAKMHESGASWRDIASLVGVDWRTVRHHVEGVQEEKRLNKTESKDTPAVLA